MTSLLNQNKIAVTVSVQTISKNEKYQFDTLASNDDQRDLSRAMQTFETKIMKRFDTLINDFKAGGHNTDNMLKSTKDEVAKVSENFGHIKQTTRMVEDNLSAKIDSEVRKLRDTLSIKFQKEIRNVLGSGVSQRKPFNVNFEKQEFAVFRFPSLLQ